MIKLMKLNKNMKTWERLVIWAKKSQIKSRIVFKIHKIIKVSSKLRSNLKNKVKLIDFNLF